MVDRNLKKVSQIFKWLRLCCSDKGFYSPEQILTYSRFWYFIIGSRSIGKSTAIAIFCILMFCVFGEKWIYCRRTKDEVLLTAYTFFSNAVKIINDNTDFGIHEVIYSSQKFYISFEKDKKEVTKTVNDEEVTEYEYEQHECGMIIPLSLEQKYKSGDYSDFFTIIYDEFIAKEDTQYLGNAKTLSREYKAMLSLYQTVDRGINTPFRNETRVFFLGNKSSVFNPILLGVGAVNFINNKSKIIAPKGRVWLVQQIKTVPAIKDIESAAVYQLMDEEERAYAFDNEGREDTDKSFIGIPDGVVFYDRTYIINGKKYGISHNEESTYYIGSPRPEVTKKTYSLDNISHDGVDIKLIQRMADDGLVLWLRDAYAMGKLYFKNALIKQEWLKYLQYLPK